MPPRMLRPYQLYVKGRYYLEQRTRESLYKALDQFNQAIAKDPNYAQAHAGLSDAYILLFDRGLLSDDEASPKIRSAAQRAIELDPTLAEPPAALAALEGAGLGLVGSGSRVSQGDWIEPERRHFPSLVLGLRGTWAGSRRLWRRMRRPWRSIQLLPRLTRITRGSFGHAPL